MRGNRPFFKIAFIKKKTGLEIAKCDYPVEASEKWHGGVIRWRRSVSAPVDWHQATLNHTLISLSAIVWYITRYRIHLDKADVTRDRVANDVAINAPKTILTLLFTSTHLTIRLGVWHTRCWQNERPTFPVNYHYKIDEWIITTTLTLQPRATQSDEIISPIKTIHSLSSSPVHIQRQ